MGNFRTSLEARFKDDTVGLSSYPIHASLDSETTHNGGYIWVGNGGVLSLNSRVTHLC